MTDTPVMNYKAQVGLGASSPATFAPVFESESMGTEKAIIRGNGIRGEKDSNILQGIAEGLRTVKGGFETLATKAFLDFFLTYIIGGTETLDVWKPLQAENPDFFMEVDKGVKVYQYAGCKVNTATFSASKGEPLKCVLDIIGKTETENNAGTAASLVPDLDTPYVFSDCVFTHNGSTRFVEEFTLVIDNKLKGDRHMNSQDVTEIPSGGFAVSGTLKLGATSNNQDLKNLAGAITGSSLKLGFESAATAKYLEFLMANTTVEGDTTQKVTGKEDELMLDIAFTANRVSGGSPVDSLVVINAETKPI